MEYTLNIVEYNELLEQENKPYAMFLSPLTLEQFKVGIEHGYVSYIREKNQSEFLEIYFKEKVPMNGNPFKLDTKNVFIAIRFMGGTLPEDMKDLKFDHDIEIYHVKLMENEL